MNYWTAVFIISFDRKDAVKFCVIVANFRTSPFIFKLFTDSVWVWFANENTSLIIKCLTTKMQTDPELDSRQVHQKCFNFPHCNLPIRQIECRGKWNVHECCYSVYTFGQLCLSLTASRNFVAPGTDKFHLNVFFGIWKFSIQTTLFGHFKISFCDELPIFLEN